MSRHELMSSLLLLVSVVTVGGQQKPDFSGEWILNRQDSSLSPAAAAIQSGLLRIEHREPKFHYQVRFEANGAPIEYAFDLTSDGLEVTGTDRGRRTATSLRWHGEALVLASTVEGPEAGTTLSVAFRYELVEAGRRLRATERLRGRGRDQDNVWIFERR